MNDHPDAAPRPPPTDLLIAVWQQEPPLKLIERLRTAHGGLGDDAQASLAAALRSQLLRVLPPRAAYLGRVLRAFVAEGGNGALRDDLAEAHAAALLAPPDPAGGWSHRTYCYLPGGGGGALDDGREAAAALRELEAAHVETVTRTLAADGDDSGGGNSSGSAVPVAAPNIATPQVGSVAGLITLRLADDFLRGNTGCAPWEAGFLLAEYALAHAERFKGRRCIDVGAGAGLAGVALWRAGAVRVVLADGDAGAVGNAARNAALNGARAAVAPSIWAVDDDKSGDGGNSVASAAIVCCQMRWEDAAADGAPPLPLFDAVVASDVLYDPCCVPAFVRVLRRLLAPHSGGRQRAVGYVASTLRNPATLALFESTARDEGLEIEPLATGPWPAAATFVELAALADRSALRLHRVKTHIDSR